MRETTIVPIQLGFSTAYLLRGERPILLDTGFRGSTTVLLRALARARVSPSDLSLLLISHGHTDHYGNAAALRELSGAPLAVGRADAMWLAAGHNAPFPAARLAGRLLRPVFSVRRVTSVAPVPVDITVDETLDLRPFGVAGAACATPGHTPGSLTVLLDDARHPGRVDAALIGDLVLGPRLPLAAPRYPMFVTDEDVLRRSIRHVASLSPACIYPAHGRPFTTEQLCRAFSWLASHPPTAL